MASKFLIALAAALALAAAAGCAATINPATIQDARTAARVKTAIVNDATVGVHPIEVRVQDGVVRLSGWVPSATEAERAVSLASAVPGVIGVRSELRIGGVAPPVPSAGDRGGGGTTVAPADAKPEDGPRRLLGLGGSFGWAETRASALGRSVSIRPLVRIGAGTGLGMAIGFGWFGTELRSHTSSEVLGRVTVKPLMAGPAYSFRGQEALLTLSLVAGVALNNIGPSDQLTGREIPLALTDSLAVRPGASLWIETSRRTAFNVSVGYLVTRPWLTLVEDGEVVRRALRGDALLLRAGLVYQIF